MPQISVIVPVYKVEQYLARCVQSVLSQTYADFELILVDDGSPDGCPGMCDEWAKKDPRIRVIHKENGGLSSARNAGMDVMRGKYVCFIDSDDWVAQNMLAQLLHLLEKYPQAQIASCGFVRETKYKDKIEQPLERVEIYDSKKMLDYFFRINGEASNYSVWNKMIAAEILDGFRFVETLNEDVEASYEFYTRATCMVKTNQRLYYYFMNNTGITRSIVKKKDMEYLDVWERVKIRTVAEHPEYSYHATMGRKRANFTLLSKMLLRGYDKLDPEMRKVKSELKKAVRRDFKDLMHLKMPISRKMLLIVLCLI